ncbi:NEL-type E3 ubiquitin ligase domain-containing protein [Pseudomonas sp. BF-R-24]|uniref:NEL-type E3 ubiquitin ligase domain-containing protein n=1 Tax=Pseudomonas sp. BF-R-24 TaxID=2832386 RepID=UPI001CBCC926|nr:NEL-type E3 ubiquitin ligase domain-containing protein [Pseudomonas sp. BF-R-24]
MPITPSAIQGSDPIAIARFDKSIHFHQVRKAIPSWLLNTSPSRVDALKSVRLTLPDWHRTSSTTAHRKLKKAIQLSWTSQNTVDQALRDLLDVSAFAKPLLQQKLRDRFGVEDDVEETWLRLYAPVKTGWWVHDFSGGTTSRTISMLDAALHNFSQEEAFTQDSEFITRPDARGHFNVKHLKHKLSIEQFKSVCRELDIGARYQQHLQDTLKPTDKAASNVLRHKVILSQKSALNVAAQMALMKHDIDQEAFDVVLGMLNDRSRLQWNGKPVDYYNLAMMDTSLSGIILIATDINSATAPTPVIAYVPHDPLHPLKQYTSLLELMAELTRQLRDGESANSYQQFFSQFVPHEQRGHFFAGLNARLSTVKWQPVAAGSSLPSWRDTPVDKPDLQFSVSSIKTDRATTFNNDLWGYRYRQTLNKIFNDAREIAISTEYADRMARWAWWDNLEKMLSDILNIALLVATPMVPGLGTLMMAYTAYQLTDGVVEGLVDLAEGRLAEAGEQTLGVLESVVQLGVFAAAGAVGNVAQAKLSPFFEGLKPVQLANGETRLWNPDLSPYQRIDVELPADARPDDQGIHQHQGRRILRLDDQHFEVLEDPVTGQQRIRHPQRFDAYAPTLRHNGRGAWVCETENPREWEGSTLMRRLGHSTDGFNDEQLEQIRQISGTDEAELRRMHVESAPPPPLLTDTLQRLASPPITPAAVPAEIAPLFSEFPELPATVAERIHAGASAGERQRITQENRLPLRLRTQARELQFETQTVRAAQGLYPSASITPETERLVLGTLRFNTDTFGDLRLEIRQGTFDGELRYSVGPDDATRVRVLIRDEAGRYQVRDGENQPIHEADDFFEAVLHATQENGQNSLGYKPGDGDGFRQWVMVKSAPPSERRTVLADPPVRPVAERETMLLVRGGGLSREGQTLPQRIHDLYPHFSDAEVDTFASALTERGEPMRAIEQHEGELNELRIILNRWRNQQPPSWGPDSKGFLNGGGDRIAEGLIQCFERTNSNLGSRTDPSSYGLDLSGDMLPINLENWWSQRPDLRRFLDRITHLKLDNTRFSSKANGLLRDFPNLRELSARGCELTSLPENIGAMQRLERLSLIDNEIVLDAAAVEQLKQLDYLEILRLDENPLGRVVDISGMPRLKVVGLRDTVTTTWPEGTLSKTRPRGFLLDLRDNPINLIPEVVPGSPQAWVVGRTRLDVGNLSESNQGRYQAIRRSVQLPPEPIVASNSLAEWVVNSDYSAKHWNDVPGWGVDRANLWSELVDEPQAQGFLKVLLDTRLSRDFQTPGPTRNQLVQRVWRMLDAVYVDTPLREKLFTMAVAPVDCADAGAQLFNHMGIHVLAYEAHAYSTDPAQLEQKLVTLAKGAARLEQVNDIARADVASRGGNPDEVEVYLAYQTGLAQRLDLPWQSKGMLFRPVSGVTDAMIDQAYDTVLALGEGDGLVDRMLEQDFWQNHLNERYATDMEANKRRYLGLSDQLDTLRDTQREWVESSSELQRAALRSRLRELMNDLPVPDTVVFADEPLSDGMFDRLLVDLGDAEKELSRRLTRQAMRHAGQ